MKWGDKYPAVYVNRLYAMVQRNLSLEHRFVCFTEDSTGLSDGIEVLPLPDLGVPVPKDVPGKWRKTALWQKELFGLQGVALFIDLDSVIVDRIDDFFAFGNTSDVILARNWLKPLSGLGQTTLFRFQIGSRSHIFDDFVCSPQATATKYQFEQHYVTSQIKSLRSAQELLFWPKKWVRHYRIHCLGNNYLMRYVKPAKLPLGTKIVAFPGVPNPDESLRGVWNANQTTHPSFWEHIQNLFPRNRRTKPGFFAHLKSYHHNCPWIESHWQE